MLIIGSCVATHGLAWKCSRSSLVEEVLVAPGNGGTVFEPGVRNIAFTDPQDLLETAVEEGVSLVIPMETSPEALEAVEQLSEAGIDVFGPTGQAVKLDTDPAFRLNILRAAGVAVPRGEVFTSAKTANAWVATLQEVPVIHIGSNGNVSPVLCRSMTMTKKRITQHFQDGGENLYCEERLQGIEVEVAAIVDEITMLPLPLTVSYRSRYTRDADKGTDNELTAGMGCYSLQAFPDHADERTLSARILQPVLAEMRRNGTPLQGFLHARVVLHPDGTPFVTRLYTSLGQAVAPAILMRLNSDLVPVVVHACESRLHEHKLTFRRYCAVSCVIIRDQGNKKSRDNRIKGISLRTGSIANDQQDSVKVFHMSTRVIDQREIELTDNHVFTLCALGDGMPDARKKLYAAVDEIEFAGMSYRDDIGSTLAEFGE